MGETTRTSVKAKIFRKISKDLSDYCIYLCSTKDFSHIPPSVKKNGQKTYITIVGTNLPMIESVEIEYYGEWISNKKYGIQFKADSYSLVEPSTERGIKSFLKSKAFPGIGEKTAELIVNAFGKDTLSIIKDNPNQLLTVPGITPGKLGLIVSAYKKNEGYSMLAVFLSGYGISSDNVAKINEKLGANAVDKIRKNPYCLQDVKGIGFRSCDKIAKGLLVALDSFERIHGSILEAIHSHIQITGDTCIKASLLEEQAMKLLNENLSPMPVSSEAFRTVAKRMAEEGELVFRSKEYVFLSDYDYAEEYSALQLIKLKEKEVEVSQLLIMDAIEKFRKESAMRLTDNQADAILTALSNRVSVITGGPGTGKTTILSAIISCYKSLFKKEVILLAPTGKAARRMTEATGEVASTIHSKIHIFDSDAYYDPELLPEGLIVIDEASMVDGLLFSKLIKAIGDGDSHLLMIGDIDQLPSVSAGAVLYDLIRSDVIPVVRLTEVFRQLKGGSIIENANNINSGEKSLICDNDFEIIEVTSEDEALSKIKDCYYKEAKEKGIDNVALLSPLRRSQNGRFKIVSDELNSELQDVVNPKKPGKCCNLYNTEYRVGDRVLQWKNTEVSSNGDIGQITNIIGEDGDIAITIKWDNGNTTIENRQTMNDISLAYAISIHKSQGSEYNSVIIPLLSKLECQLYKRQLLYTGITRAKQHAIIIGNVSAINTCIERCDANARKTLFAERLKYFAEKVALS